MPDMVRMVSQAEHVYAGRSLRAGEEFDCEKQHVELFKVLGWARDLEGPAVEQRSTQTYKTRDMAAEQPKHGRGRNK